MLPSKVLLFPKWHVLQIPQLWCLKEGTTCWPCGDHLTFWVIPKDLLAQQRFWWRSEYWTSKVWNWRKATLDILIQLFHDWPFCYLNIYSSPLSSFVSVMVLKWSKVDSIIVWKLITQEIIVWIWQFVRLAFKTYQVFTTGASRPSISTQLPAGILLTSTLYLAYLKL